MPRRANFGNLTGLIHSLCDPELANGSRLILAGGFLRDTAFGAMPKDLDLYIVGAGHSPAYMVDRLSKIYPEIFDGAKYTTFTDEYPNDFELLADKARKDLDRDDFNGRVEELIKVKLKSGIDLDIISLEGTQYEGCSVVRTFDLSCNALWYDMLINTQYILEYDGYSMHPRALHGADNLNMERVKYIKEKHRKTLGWRTLDEQIAEEEMINKYPQLVEEVNKLRAIVRQYEAQGQRKPQLHGYKQDEWGGNRNKNKYGADIRANTAPFDKLQARVMAFKGNNINVDMPVAGAGHNHFHDVDQRAQAQHAEQMDAIRREVRVAQNRLGEWNVIHDEEQRPDAEF